MARYIKKWRKVNHKTKKEFTPNTRLYDKVRPEYHNALRQMVDDIKPYLINGENVNWKQLKRIEVNYYAKSEGKRSLPSSDVINCLARFLITIGKDNGLKCSMAVIIRYLCSKEHSNFCMKEKSLNTKIYRALAYFDGEEKDP